jgi:opacity protein-like surface antigen
MRLATDNHLTDGYPMRHLIFLLLAGCAFAITSPTWAADLARLDAAVAAPESDAYDWTGGYIGANIEYSVGHTPATYASTSAPFLGADIDTNPKGFGGGVGIGFNRQLSNGIVVGIEGDVDYGSISDTIPDTVAGGGNTVTATLDWTGTVRGRVGVATGIVLPYLTAGLAVANSHIASTDVTPNFPDADSAFLTGWTAGGGIEIGLGDNWSAKGEVLYADLGTHTYFMTAPWKLDAHATYTTAKFGLNYRF